MEIWKAYEEHYRKLGINPEEICEDGIINEENYGKPGKKLLFVL